MGGRPSFPSSLDVFGPTDMNLPRQRRRGSTRSGPFFAWSPLASAQTRKRIDFPLARSLAFPPLFVCVPYFPSPLPALFVWCLRDLAPARRAAAVIIMTRARTGRVLRLFDGSASRRKRALAF